MKKIVFLIDNLKGGGAEKAIKIIVEGLYEKGLNPIVILLENQKDYNLKNGIEIYSLTENMTKYSFLFLGLKLLKLLKIVNPDIIFATNTKSQILSLVVKSFYSAKRIINIQVDLTKQYEGRDYIFKFFSKLLNSADAYSFISKGIFENLKSKIPKKENIFIPNPIDFNEIDKLKTEPLEEEYRKIFYKKTFITIGRLTRQKGQWILLEAFSKMEDDSNLIILGNGEKEKELKKLAKNLDIQERVFFLGFQTNPFKFLYQADIFILSSLWEGFGNVIVEAMRCNLPVISTDCLSGPREILAPKSDFKKQIKDKVELAEYGILTPVGDADKMAEAMELMIKDENLKERYKKASLKRAEDFDKEKIVKEFINKVLK